MSASLTCAAMPPGGLAGGEGDGAAAAVTIVCGADCCGSAVLACRVAHAASANAVEIATEQHIRENVIPNQPQETARRGLRLEKFRGEIFAVQVVELFACGLQRSRVVFGDGAGAGLRQEHFFLLGG